MTLLVNAMTTRGDLVDVSLQGGLVAKVVEAGQSEATHDTIDLEGRLLLPALGEPHAHLDKAFTADVFPNPRGDLIGAVEAILLAWPTVSVEDIAERAERAVRRLVASGTTAIRSHADLTPEGELKSVAALTEVQRRTSHLCHLEIVALTMPLGGDADGRKRLIRALELGANVVGACPHLDDAPLDAIDSALAAAADAGTMVDLHFDEVLDASVQYLPELARRVEARGLGGKVTASHCVSHGLLDPKRQREVASMLASAGISVVANPRTNLYLQARGIEQAPPRGLTGVRALLDEGVLVAGGADNVQDPFYIIGRSDPLETASLLIAAAHLSVEEAWQLVSANVFTVLGLSTPEIIPGARADLVAIRAGSVRESIADQPADRLVFFGGQLVARTAVESWVA